jgi:N-acetylglucosaminyldiphosphoundecaprenol N-acetyl-beta-D-mannosaminyltransferase
VRTSRVLGAPVAATSLAEACDELERWIALGRREFVVLANVHVVETARRDSAVADALEHAGLVLPDGAPLAWSVRRAGGPKAERITGSDLFDELCRRSPAAGHRHFFYGSTPETLEVLTRLVRNRYPGIDVCGSLSPPFSRSAELRPHDMAAIDAARPDVVWVGLGAPKQELWMRLARAHLEAPLLLGVGAVFDFASGRKQRAPRLVQRLGLEWAHRLAHEPRRLAKRYLVTNTTFTLAVLRGLARSGDRP